MIFFFVAFASIKLGLILVALSMFFSPETVVGYLGHRPIIIRMEDLLIPMLLMAWVGRISVGRGSRLLIATPLNVPILSLLVLCVGSTLHGIWVNWVYVYPLPAFFYILKLTEYFTIFYLVTNFVRTEKEVKYYLVVSLVVLALISLYSLAQVPSVQIFSHKRITAPFEGNPEPASIGGYMAFLLLIVISLWLYERDPMRRWFFSILGIVVFIPFLFTLNRASYAAFLGGLLFLALVGKKKWLKFGIVIALLFSPLLLPKAVKERIAFTWEEGSLPGRELGVDMSFQERIYSFRKMWNTGKYSPLIGWGISSMEYPDSQYSRTLHEIGILGLGLWLWIFLRLYRMSRWLFHNLEDGMLKGLSLGYWASIIGLLVHGFGTITFYIVRIMEPFWFISGLVVSLYLIKSREALPDVT